MIRSVYTPSPAIVQGSAGLRPLGGGEPPAQPWETPDRAPLVPQDRVTISAGARARQSQPGAQGAGAPPAGSGADRGGSGGQGGVAGQLTPAQQRQVAELRARDADVRSHEAAHEAAGGDLTGGASFTYEVGPDGRRYAIGGEVSVQLHAGRTPDETIAIAERVRRAALAPADPSPQDLAVAAAASRMEADARAQKARDASAAYAGQNRAAQAGAAQGTTGEAKTSGSAAAAAAPARRTGVENVFAHHAGEEPIFRKPGLVNVFARPAAAEEPFARKPAPVNVFRATAGHA